MPTTATARLLVAATLLIPWLSAPFILIETLERNAIAGLYGESDAIFFPFAGALVVCALGLPYLLVLLYKVIGRLRPKSQRVTGRLVLRSIYAFIVVGPGAIGALLLTTAWLDIPHAPIAAAYAVPAIWLLLCGPLLVRYKSAT